MKLKLLSIVLFFISAPTFQSQCSYNQTTTGAAHNLAIYSDGTLWAWGNNSYGQLGDGTNIDKNTPTKIGINTTWNSISSNLYHNLGIKNDGTLWAWGRNNHGQLGDGTNVDKNTPTQIGTDTNWSTISIGHFHSLALKNDGTLWAWGGNNGGQLGDGTNIDKNTPIQIGTDTNWGKISGGKHHNSGIKNDGTLWAWGDNSFGQLGDATNINKITPTQIGTDINWSTISSRDSHCLAIKNNGTLWAWGYNSLGQLGIGSYINQTTPTQIGTDTNWNTISANYSKSLAIKNNGTLWGSGNNGNGDLGDGTISNKNILTQIGTDTNWATTISGGNHSIVKKNDGSLWASGANFSGQLGDGTNVSKNTHSAVFCASTYVPDDGFEANLIALGYDSGPLDDYVPTANISNVTQLHIDVLVIGDPDISDFTGIEDFTALTDFRANFVSAPSIDLSNNTALLNVNVIGNQLTEVNIKNGTNTILQTLNIISVTNGLVNPLKICVDDTAYANTTFGDIYAAGIYYVENCTAQVNRITGTTYFDANNSGSCDPSEAVASNGNIITTGANNSFTTFPFREEYATYSLDQGNVTTQLQGIPTYFTVTPSITTINYTNTGNIDVVDYCLTANSIVNDLQVESYAVTASKPGFQTRIRIKYRNTGTTSLSGAVTLNYPGSLEVFNNAFDVSDGSTSTPFPPTMSNNILTWNVTSIAPFETRYIDAFFTINTPTDPNNPVLGGDMMTYISAITPSTGDATPTNNTHTFTDTVVNAYDPNDVTCFEGDKISLAQVPDDLTYRIRFQNTGSAAATNILVTNDIDPDLDISTFQPIASSHAHTTTITSPTEIKFTFLNINLADSTTDEPNSHGWILYKMKPLSTAVIGDTFENNANIFFDYNAPVITNTAITTVAATTSVPDDNFENYLETHDANGNIVALGATNSMGNGIANDNLVFTCNINTITSLNVGNKNIADLSGIEDFVALTELNCSQNQLLNLNISQNTLLEDLFVGSNFLTNLNLQQHTALNLLSCYDNQLTNLNLSQNTVLQKLACYNNQLTSLNVKNGYNLNSIIFNSTNNPNLLCIEVDDAAWSTTNWTNIDPASSFSTNCTNFGLTYVPDDNFENYLETHDANGNVVSVGATNSMGNGIANDNYVTTANINAVTLLDVNNQNIADLTGIEDFTALEDLRCYRNLLTSLDLTQNTALTRIDCNNNNLTSIDLTQNTALIELILDNNLITSLDVTQNILLEILFCTVNLLTSIDVTQNTELKSFWCAQNSLTSLNVTQNTKLRVLMFSHNVLTNIDVSKNILLSSFWGSYNKLTSLDFTNNSALIYVQCQFNRLIYLNIKNGNNLNFVDLNATNNPNLTCIEVDDASWSAASWTNIDALSSFNENCHYNDTYVPDDNFENYLEANGMGNGIANDDYVTTANINTVTTLNVSSKNIADLTGVEDFTALEDLRCQINQLTSLNVTQNTALTVLHAYQNEISALDVSLNTNLTDLRCNNNLLTTLDVTQNTALVKLHNYSNQLTTINVTLNTALQQLYSNSNQLTSIDVSQNTALTHFYSYNNPLGSLDVTQNTALAYLQCNNNQLTELDVSQNSALFRLFCQDNLLTSLNIKNGNNSNMAGQFYNSSNNSNLTCIEVDDATYSASNWTNKDAASSFSEDCSNFDLTYVPDDNFEHYLETHDSSGNFVSVGSANSMGNGVDYDDYVTTSKINTISYLNINTRSIVDLTGIEDFTALSLFYCINNQITSLDLSNNLSLREIYCSSNSINTINVSQNTNLEHLTAANNQLITIDVSQNPLLDHLDVSRNLITNLDTSQNTNLIRLRCFTNQITSLDVTQSMNLIEISCYGNQLTSLDISQNINLTDLICSQNQLTSLDVSQNVVLSGLRCQDNQLTRLNAANGNNFSITNNVYFNTINNPNLTCIEVDDVAYSTANWTNIDATSRFSTNCHYNETYVPDDNFENYLETHDANGNIVTIGATNSMGNGIANDDYVTTININSVTNLDVSSKSILDLTGIADFSQLLVLNIGSNNNIVFDISQNTVLESLYCHSSSLTSAALNVSQNISLKNLYCQNNQLSALDVSANLNLETLNCFQNSITALDLSANSSLISLFATNNQLTSLNVKNTNNTNFTVFNATNNPNLTCIEVDNATYSRANWTNIDTTSSFNNNCANPEVYVPDDNFETYLETHDANGNVVPLGDTSSMGNGILLDDYVTLSKIANVSTLNIPNLNIQNIIGIKYFSNLSNLNCSNNSINNIDVSQNTALTVFSCSFNQISNINISTNTNLFHLNVSNNNLGNIDISNNTALTFLNCENNQINNLNVNQNNLLTHLAVNNNLLTVIDLTQNLSLVTFICDFNKLSTLNLSLHTVLQQFSAVDNQLAYLNIKNGNNINFNIFYSSGNQNLTCIIVDDSSYSDLNWSSFKDTTSTFVNNQSECAALTTNEYNSLEFSLYPNPTNGSINVTILEKAELIIYSLIGKELKKVKLNSGKNEITHLNLANGIYLFKVVGKDKSSTKKVLVN